MLSFDKTPVVVWAHGFGAHPTTDPVGWRVESYLAELGVTVHRPSLSVVEDGFVIPYPLDEQATIIAKVATEAAERGDPVLLAAHSQGSLPTTSSPTTLGTGRRSVVDDYCLLIAGSVRRRHLRL